jgi:hypothetical protein
MVGGGHSYRFDTPPQTPYELMRKNHRAAQRLVEKEFNQLQVGWMRPNPPSEKIQA